MPLMPSVWGAMIRIPRLTSFRDVEARKNIRLPRRKKVFALSRRVNGTWTHWWWFEDGKTYWVHKDKVEILGKTYSPSEISEELLRESGFWGKHSDINKKRKTDDEVHDH